MTKNKKNIVDQNTIKEFIVYGREDCHLCQDMILALQNLQEQVSFKFEMINIDTSVRLITLYGNKIPVLISKLDNKEICHYFLDRTALDEYLVKFR
ncbi:MAG: glutaredoxin family protein [Pseudomonadota bacterium]